MEAGASGFCKDDFLTLSARAAASFSASSRIRFLGLLGDTWLLNLLNIGFPDFDSSIANPLSSLSTNLDDCTLSGADSPFLPLQRERVE